MNLTLEGKRAIVTGGTRGIGFAIARQLAEAGCRVVICGRGQASVDKAVAELTADAGIKVFGCPADVSIQEEVAALFRFADGHFDGGLEILVNNAGIGIFKKTAELSIEDWKRVMDVNMTGTFACTKEALPRMIRSGSGYVVNVSSLAGKNPFATGAAYNASKFAMNGFSEALMLDHRYDNIRVTYVMPGSVDTDFSPRSSRETGRETGRETAGESGADWKIASTDVADMVLAVLRMPERTMVSRIEMRPAKPKK